MNSKERPPFFSCLGIDRVLLKRNGEFKRNERVQRVKTRTSEGEIMIRD